MRSKTAVAVRLRKRALPLFALWLAAVATADAAPQDARAQFVTLGTGGGPITRLQRSEPANAVVVGHDVYLFDVGDGVQRQMVAAGLQMSNVRAIFITHHHIDHNADLGPLLVTRWLFNDYRPLPVIGPPGTVEMVEHLVAAYRPTELAPITIGGPKKPPLGASVAGRDLASTMIEPAVVYEDATVRVLAVTNEHYHFAAGSEEERAARSYSFRIETPGRTFVYTGDTGPSKNVEKLARNADVLVSEVIDLASMKRVLIARNLPDSAMTPLLAHMEQDHLTPEQVGHLASQAGVKRVVLTHLSPGMDNEPDTTGYVAAIAATFKGEVKVASDLDRF